MYVWSQPSSWIICFSHRLILHPLHEIFQTSQSIRFSCLIFLCGFFFSHLCMYVHACSGHALPPEPSHQSPVSIGCQWHRQEMTLIADLAPEMVSCGIYQGLSGILQGTTKTKLFFGVYWIWIGQTC